MWGNQRLKIEHSAILKLQLCKFPAHNISELLDIFFYGKGFHYLKKLAKIYFMWKTPICILRKS